MAETGCLKDGHFQNLEVESNTKITMGSFDFGTVSLAARTGLDLSLASFFGGGTRNDSTSNRIDLVCPTTATVPVRTYAVVSDYIKSIQNTSDGKITVAQATELLGNPDNPPVITDVTLTQGGSSTWLGAGDTNDSRVVVLNATVNGNITTTAADNDISGTVGMQALLLFNNFTFDGVHFVALLNNPANKYLQAGNKVFVSASAGSYTSANSGKSSGLKIGGTTPTEPADADVKTILTSSGACTIEKGSYLYFNNVGPSNEATNCLHVHGVIRTSTGTIAVSFDTAP